MVQSLTWQQDCRELQSVLLILDLKIGIFIIYQDAFLASRREHIANTMLASL